jgi:hypothetical protein
MQTALDGERKWIYELFWSFSTMFLALVIGLAFYRCMYQESYTQISRLTDRNNSASVTSFQDSWAKVSG